MRRVNIANLTITLCLVFVVAALCYVNFQHSQLLEALGENVMLQNQLAIIRQLGPCIAPPEFERPEMEGANARTLKAKR